MKAKLLLAGLLVAGLAAPAVAADNLKEMFTQASVKGNIRLYSFTRDFNAGTTDQQDTALGGALYYKTDSFKGISLGTAFGATSDIVNDDDKGTYYGITDRNHENVARLQEYYIQGDYFATRIKAGAHELNTPFMHKHDIRVIPRTYRGLSIENKSIENLTLSGYLIKDYENWVNEEFISLVNDVYIADAVYKLPVKGAKAQVEAAYFTMEDALDQTYLTATFGKKIGDYLFHAKPTWFTQKSQGEERVGEIDTYQLGGNAGVSVSGFDLTAYYAKTGDNSIYNQWGYRKILVQQVVSSGDHLSGDRSDEDAFGLKLSYNFANAGIKGLQAYVFAARYDAPASVINETDLSIRYNFSGALEGFSIWGRYANVDKDSGQEDLDDMRLYLTWKF